MEVFEVTDRERYLETQITRSKQKFGYCKVSIRDCSKYKDVIFKDMRRAGYDGPMGPIACLGSRNGREVDLFRTAFFQGKLLTAMIGRSEIFSQGINNKHPFLNRFGRSRYVSPGDRDVIGVEINPDSRRQDVWVGSFDEMPAQWENRFRIVFSNSFDQSMSPKRAAKEWKRVLKPGGYLIFCYGEAHKPLERDPVGMINQEDVMMLFGGRQIFYQHHGSAVGYSEIILRF